MEENAKPAEVKKEDSDVKYSFKRDHGKSLKQLATEIREKRKAEILKKLDENNVEKPKTDEPNQPQEENVEKPVENKEPKEKQEEVKQEPKIDTEEIARRAREDAERIASEKLEVTKKEFQAKIDEILNKDKNLAEKQKEADELVAVWDKENRLPKDWREIANEQLRISEAKFEQRLKAQRSEDAAKQEEQNASAQKQKAEVEEKQKADRDLFLKSITDDLADIIESKHLPRPSDISEINNPQTTDMAAKQIQEVFQFGVKLNTERVQKGLEPVRSFNKIFFLHYQPYKATLTPKSAQPAGADAPVSGAKNIAKTESKKAYVYARDHNKSWGQIKAELMQSRRIRA